MSQVILLTSNLYAEQAFEQHLKFLGHEVFCTSKVVINHNYFKRSHQLFNCFDFLFISETIPEETAATILLDLQTTSIISVRKVGELPTKQKEAVWVEQGLDQWILNTASIEDIREKMASCSIHKQEALQSQSLTRDTSFFSFHWTKTEQKILDVMIKSEAPLVSRGQLCKEVWGTEQTHSRLSQLSSGINNIKKKLRAAGIREEMIITVWGKGYQLNRQFVELIQKET